MILTIEQREQAKKLVENPGRSSDPHFPDPIKKRILNSTVRLYGNCREDVHTSFNGSGVIFRVDSDYTYILTAAHLLLIWADKKYDLPADFKWSDYTGDFCRAVTISYGKGDLTFNASPSGIANANLVDATSALITGDNSLYDVLIIQSKDRELKKFARENVFFEEDYAKIAATIKQEAVFVMNKPPLYLDFKHYYYVQLGYGDTSDARTSDKLEEGKIVQRSVTRACETLPTGTTGTKMTKNYLHYRLTHPSVCKEIVAMYNQIAKNEEPPKFFKYLNVLVINGRNTGSTAEGDSGGPLYAVHKTQYKAYLLGVTTGADMQAKIKNGTSTYVSHRVFNNDITTSIAEYWKTVYPSDVTP